MTARSFRAVALATALLGAVAGGARAEDFTFTFDFESLAIGSNVQNSLPAGITISAATFGPVINPDGGDPYPNSDRWFADTSAPAITVSEEVDDAFNPTGNRVIGDFFSPIILSVRSPYTYIRSITFEVDADTFGDPSVPVIYQAVGNTLNFGFATQNIDTTVPNAQYTFVSPVPTLLINDVILPSGTFYDRFSITVTDVVAPEPTTLSLLGLVGLGGLIVRRRNAR